MVPGGTTETISYFAGYLRLDVDLSRPWVLYEDPAFMYRIDLELESAPSDDNQPALPALGSRPVKLPLDVPEALPERNSELHEQVLPPPVVHTHVIYPDAPLGHLPHESGGSSDYTVAWHFDYDVTPHEVLAEVRQQNRLDDNDIVGDPATGFADLHGFDVAEATAEMTAKAWAQTPEGYLLGEFSADEVVSLVNARHTERIEGDKHDASVPKGIYLNGEPVTEWPADEEEDEETPRVDDDQVLLGYETPGVDAQLGGNNALNQAVILDLNDQHSALVVFGDYVRTSGIFQVNALHDSDAIMAGGGSGEKAVKTGGNEIRNVAEFRDAEFTPREFGGFSADAAWQVDIIDGDFFDVKALFQSNWISDNDAVTQTSETSYYSLYGGGNESANLAQSYEFTLRYDLVVVLGNYHKADLIYQYNVVLDDDIVRAVNERDDGAGMSIGSGANSLNNEASIINYGNPEFQELSPEFATLLEAVGSGGYDPSLLSQLPGANGAPINVLFVTGDYYDVNLVWQMNVIADADIAMQYLPALGDDGAGATQAASVGGNGATNLATIVDTGTTSEFQFLGGEAYEDALLVQANIVTEESEVTVGDPAALVSEVIAFLETPDGNADQSTDDGCHGTSIPQQQDLMAGVMA